MLKNVKMFKKKYKALQSKRAVDLVIPYVCMPRSIKPPHRCHNRHKAKKRIRGVSSFMTLSPLINNCRRHLLLIGEADIHLHTARGTVPFPLCQLSLVIEPGLRDLALVPAAVFFLAEHGGPEAFHVMTRLRVDALHLPQEEILQHLLVEFPRVLVNSLPSHGKDGARLESDRLRWAVATKVVEEVFEVLRRSLDGSLTLEHTLER